MFNIWNDKMWCRAHLAPMLKSQCKIWYKFPRLWHKKKHRRCVNGGERYFIWVCGCLQVEASRWLLGWLLLFPGGI